MTSSALSKQSALQWLARPEAKIEIEKELCRRSLAEFVRRAWHVLEPTTPYVHGWHIDAISEHLEAVSNGQITRLLINVPPGPMRQDSQVETARGVVALKDVVVGDYVLTHKGRYRRVSAVHHQGVLPILEIVTHSGRVTHAAPSHPYLTPRGWVDARDLKVGDILAVVNRSEDRPHATKMPPEEARALGYLVGDGSLTQGMPLFVNADREVIDDFKACISALGFETSESRRSTHWVVRIKGGEQVRAWLDSHGLAGASSYTKRIPARVMNGDKDAVANFIGAYWTCDGGFDVRPTRERLSRYRAYGTTVSEALAVDLVYALGLLGIESRLRRKARRLDTAAQPGGVYKSFSVEVQKEACTALFADLPGLCSRKKAIAANCQRTFERPLWDDPIVSITSAQDAPCMCLTVEEDSSFVCSGIAVKNTMKSLLSSVFWPAWEWGPLGRPQTRIIGASYELQGLATRDARKMRLLVQSDWFQKRWPIAFAADQDAKMRFENRATGWRAAKAITSLTGERGDRLIIDDPHSIKTAESDANRAEALMNFREAAPSRLVDQAKSAIIVIMQRVHQEDIAGYIIEHEPHYQKLILPMEFEADRRCVTSIGFEDPREEEGELLFPARFSREVVDRDKRTMGEYAVAGQFQQRPSPRQGGLFKADRIKIVDAIPDGVRDWVRAWDLAGTEGAGAWTAGVLMGRHKDGYIIADVDRFQLSPGAVQNRIKEVAKLDGKRIPIRIPQDPGQAGKGQVQDYAKALDGFILKAVPPTGDKETRALPLAVQVENERVQMLRGEWNDAFLAEMRLFPAGRYKDQIDAAADAYAELVALPSTPTLAAPLGATRQSAFYGQAG